jgi:hypothetical protein
MRIDIDQIRRQYADSSDGALLELNRDDLTEAARACYDEELQRRGLDRAGAATQRRARPSAPIAGTPAADAEEADEALAAASDPGDRPDWLDGAAEAYSQYLNHAGQPARQALRAHAALTAAGIPAILEMREEPAADANSAPAHRCCVLVPGELNLQATSVLEIEIFNKDFEVEWRAHLGSLSEEQLEAADPQLTFGGLIDKIERATRAYDEELERRGISQA